MKKITFVFFLLITTLSCSEEDYPKEQMIESYYLKYMNYPYNINNTLVYIEYDSKNRIIKRKGNFSSVSQTSGYSHFFSDQILDEISYQKNKVTIEKKTSTTDFLVPKFKRFLSFNNEGKLIQKIIETDIHKDTVNYNYNQIGQLISSKVRKNNILSEESFYFFNEQNNLDSIITNKYQIILTESTFSGKTIETFKNYDSVYNPIKKMMFFEETFNRSLSENNYSTYSREEYDRTNTQSRFTEINWNFIYDELGNIRFDMD